MTEEELKKVLKENERQEQEINPKEFIKIDPECQYFRRNFDLKYLEGAEEIFIDAQVTTD